MSYYPNDHKYAPGLGGKTNGKIDSMIIQWRRLGIGVVKERSRK